jgi:subtilase family serine protease
MFNLSIGNNRRLSFMAVHNVSFIRKLQGTYSPTKLLGAILCGALIMSAVAIFSSHKSPLIQAALPCVNPTTSAADQRVTLSGIIPPQISGSKVIGFLDCTKTLSIGISLKMMNQSDLDTLLAAQNDPSSPLYHKYLSPQEFADRFGRSQQDIDTLVTYLEEQNLKVISISSNRLLIKTTGTVDDIEKTFDVILANYQLGNRLVYAPQNDPSVPNAIGPMILSISGLDDATQLQPRATR